jgi:hypothetical protein
MDSYYELRTGLDRLVMSGSVEEIRKYVSLVQRSQGVKLSFHVFHVTVVQLRKEVTHDILGSTSDRTGTVVQQESTDPKNQE